MTERVGELTLTNGTEADFALFRAVGFSVASGFGSFIDALAAWEGIAPILEGKKKVWQDNNNGGNASEPV